MILTTVSTLLTLLSLPHAHAMTGKHITHEEFRATCEQMAQNGLKEWKTVDAKQFPAASTDVSKFPLSLPIVFHVINHQGKGVLAAFPISSGEIKTQLKAVRDTFRQCGIETDLQEVHYWDAPKYLGILIRSSVNPQYLGDTERCVFKPTHRDGVVNVYFVDGVADPISHMGRSHSIADYWFESEKPGDEAYRGSAIIADQDRVYGKTRYTVVPHEVGHIVINMGHTMGNEMNLMADSADLLAPIMTKQQCEDARNSRFVRSNR